MCQLRWSHVASLHRQLQAICVPCDAQAADFGPRTALKVVDALREKILAGKLKSGDAIRGELKASIVQLLESRGGSSALSFGDAKPGVVLIIGVNGGGKTTTIGKLAHKFTGEGATVSDFPAATSYILARRPLQCCTA